MSPFRHLDERFAVSPQISAGDVAEARHLGFKMIVNNRPEQEAEDQTPGAVIQEAARHAGLDYVAIPITHSGFSQAQVDALSEALKRADGPVLAYCRSGTRSTLLWALVEARRGEDPGMIAAKAAAAGYDVSPVAPIIRMIYANGDD